VSNASASQDSNPGPHAPGERQGYRATLPWQSVALGRAVLGPSEDLHGSPAVKPHPDSPNPATPLPTNAGPPGSRMEEYVWLVAGLSSLTWPELRVCGWERLHTCGALAKIKEHWLNEQSPHTNQGVR